MDKPYEQRLAALLEQRTRPYAHKFATARPRCYQRPAYTGRWMQNGYRRGKRVLRWVEHRMSQTCHAWDAPKVEDSVPARERWNCSGCIWLPVGIAAR